MTDWLLALVPAWGPWLLAAVNFASCLALPVPASIMMLAAGGFVAAGDIAGATAGAAALAGAVAGDQAGYLAGRAGGGGLLARLSARAAPLSRAQAMLASRGGVAVFLSRWLVSALGPYVNLAAGAAGTPWLRFTLWGAAGEAVWVGLYLSVGYTFAGNLTGAVAMAGNLLGLMAAGAVALGLGAWLVTLARAERTGR